MADSNPQLILSRHGRSPDTFPLSGDQIDIGRSAGNDIVINDPELSRQHARLIRQPVGYTLKDLGSTNGTFVNGRRLTGSYLLQDGDVVSLGETVHLTYQATASQPAELPLEEQPTLYDPNFVPPSAASPSPALPPAAPPDESASFEDPAVPPEPAPDNSRRSWLIGCGCGTLLVLGLCLGLLIFLDAYQQGRLLYCGGLQPFWELILGPFGFAPVCP